MAKAIHMMVRVLEEARSVDFYRKAFGLDVADRIDFPDFTLIYLRNPEADFSDHYGFAFAQHLVHDRPAYALRSFESLRNQRFSAAAMWHE